jgi:hypothetical protein
VAAPVVIRPRPDVSSHVTELSAVRVVISVLLTVIAA